MLIQFYQVVVRSLEDGLLEAIAVDARSDRDRAARCKLALGDPDLRCATAFGSGEVDAVNDGARADTCYSGCR